MLIIGSTALGTREPKDLDMLATKSEFLDWMNINSGEISDVTKYDTHYSLKFRGKWTEIFIAEKGDSNYDYLEVTNSLGSINNIPKASLDILFSIKKSHIFFPVRFEKNVIDYNYLLSIVKFDKYPNITKKRYKETENRLGKLKTPKLSKDSKTFFNQSSKFVKSYFVHDEIHNMVKYLDKPIYEYIKPEKDSVFCSKELWDNLSDEMKDMAVIEESIVISLERKILPNIFGEGKYYTSEDAFKWSLMRICTTLCSGFFRQHAADNYIRIVNSYNKNYVENFLDSVDNGDIKMTTNNKNYLDSSNNLS